MANKEVQSSEEMRKKVTVARAMQKERFKGQPSVHSDGQGVMVNALMPPKHMKKYCEMDKPAEVFFHQAMMELGLSARGHSKVLKVARTIADLDESEIIKVEHISEAIQYRSLDRKLWK